MDLVQILKDQKEEMVDLEGQEALEEGLLLVVLKMKTVGTQTTN